MTQQQFGTYAYYFSGNLRIFHNALTADYIATCRHKQEIFAYVFYFLIFLKEFRDSNVYIGEGWTECGKEAIQFIPYFAIEPVFRRKAPHKNMRANLLWDTSTSTRPFGQILLSQNLGYYPKACDGNRFF